METNVLKQDNNNNNNTTTKQTANVVIVNQTTLSQNIVGVNLGKNLANSVVIGKIHTTTKQTTFKGVAVTELRKCDAVGLVQHILYMLVAEFKQRKQFEKDYTNATIAGEAETLNVKALSLLKSYLNTNTIYRTNADGVIVSGIELTDGLKLRDTALKITDGHLLATCKKENLKAVIFAHSKAVVAQFRYIEDLNTMINKIQAEQATTTTTKAKKTKKATTTTATITAETTTATLTA